MGDMQETQLVLVQIQTLAAQLVFQVVASLGVALAWLAVALSYAGINASPAWRGLLSLIARVAVALGVLWLVVLAVAWPPLLERAGNVLGPMLAGLIAMMLVTEAVGQWLAQSPRAGVRTMAGVLTAVGFSLAVILVLLMLAWVREPMGATLIDGRYQVTEWAQILDSPWLAQGLLATVFFALLLLAALVQWTGASDRATILTLPGAWQRGLAALGVAGSLGLLWLLSRAVGAELNPVTRTTQTLYEALLTGSGNGVLRITFVFWALTLAGLTISLGMGRSDSRVGAMVLRLPVVTAPLLSALVCWQLFGKPNLAQMAGLPVADLASMLPPVVLGWGALLVLVVVVVSIWVVWRFLSRLAGLVVANQSQGAA